MTPNHDHNHYLIPNSDPNPDPTPELGSDLDHCRLRPLDVDRDLDLPCGGGIQIRVELSGTHEPSLG